MKIMLKDLENLLNSEIDPAFAKRARLIFNTIIKYKPKKVLDAGCGRGFYLKSLTLFSDIKEIHGFDINSKYLEIAQKNITDQRVKIKKSDIFNLNYPAGYFDLIICSEVLEHLGNDLQALIQLKKVLKKNGVLIITVPNKNFPFLWDPLNWILMKVFRTHVNKDIWWLAGIWADHVRLYSNSELAETVKKSGLSIDRTEKFVCWCWPFTHFILYGIGKNLVERLNFRLADRFNFQRKSVISRLLAAIIALPSKLLDDKIKLPFSSNILLVVKK